MDLITLLPILDSSELTREVRSLRNGNVVTWYNETDYDLTAIIDSDSYEKLTQICIIVKNNLVYLYVQCNNSPALAKVLLSSIEAISIQQ